MLSVNQKMVRLGTKYNIMALNGGSLLTCGKYCNFPLQRENLSNYNFHKKTIIMYGGGNRSLIWNNREVSSNGSQLWIICKR